jgi:lipoate-protein ligase A
MPFEEPRPDLIAPNPGGADDPLGESVLDPTWPWLRVFEPRDVRLVIGRHQDPERELDCARARADGVPIHRRVAGGGAVVLAPGMVVVAARLKRDHLGTTSYLERVNHALVPAIAATCGVAAFARGLGDLAVPGPDGHPRKVLGCSLRQTAGIAVYLGCLLVDDAAALMERYLRSPSREPEYRGGRDHRAFCGRLGASGATASALAAAARSWCERLLAEHRG